MKETFKFHEEIKEVRKNTLLEIGKTVQTMMSKAQEEKDCQTDLYLMMNYLQKDDEESIVDMNRQQTMSKRSKRKVEREEVITQKYPMLKEDPHSLPPSMMESMRETKEEVTNHQVKIQPFNVPYENAMVYGGKTQKQLGLISQRDVLRLQLQLDQQFDTIYKKEVEKMLHRGEEEKEPLLSNSQCSWCLPSHLITFLEPCIETMEKKKLRLTPWPDFKQTIFDAIDHRCLHAPEINGAINTSYMTLDEHLLVFICQIEGMTSRDQIGFKLLEFLLSLKYYS